MKKTILSTMAVLALNIMAHAQGKGFVSGQLSMSSESSPDDKSKTLNGTFGPRAGFNLNEHLILGLGLDYTGSRFTNTFENAGLITETENTSTLVTITPFARYMKKVDEDFSLYGQLSVGVGFGKNTNESVVSGNGSTTTTKSKSDVNEFTTTIGPGVQYAFAPHWAVTAEWGALRYDSRSFKPDVDGAEKYTKNTFGLALDPSALTFGLNWLF